MTVFEQYTDYNLKEYVRKSHYTDDYSIMGANDAGDPFAIVLSAGLPFIGYYDGGLQAMSVAQVIEVLGIIASVTLDEAYNASGGASTITVDDGDVLWNATGAYNFRVRVNDATDGYGFVVDHYIPPNGDTTHFSLLEDTNQLSWTAKLRTFAVASLSASSFTINGGLDLTLAGNFAVDLGGASYYQSLEKYGPAGGDNVFLSLDNISHTASMANTDTIIRFRQYYHDAVPAFFKAGTIYTRTESSATATPSTQNTSMIFSVCFQGNEADGLTLTSKQNILTKCAGEATSETGCLIMESGTLPTAAWPTDCAHIGVADRGGTAGKAAVHMYCEDGTGHVFGDLVGIGTITPSAYVHIQGNGGGSTLDLFLKNISSSTADSNQARMRLSAYGDLLDGVVFGKFCMGCSYAGAAYFWNTENTDFIFATNNTARMYLKSTGRLGLGTTAPTDRLNVTADGSAGTATLGSELLVNGTFDTDLSSWTAGANWAWGAGGTADHTAGSVETLKQTIATTNGSHYQVVVVLSSVTASNVVMTLTSSSGSESFTLSAAATYTYSFKAGAASSDLTFTPNTAFIGSITSVSFKLITPASVYAFATMDSGGSRSGLASIATDDALGNCFVGIGSGIICTTGIYNTALGIDALGSTTTGNYNNAQGSGALYRNTIGSANCALGQNALYSNTTGSWNVGISQSSLYCNTTGESNVAIGQSSLYSNTTGHYQTGIGTDAGNYISGGANPNQTSNNSVYVGALTKALASGDANEIVIGYDATGIGSNTAILGNSSITKTQLQGNVGIGTSTFGTNATRELALINGTPAAAAITDGIQIYSEDTTDNTATLALFLEQAIEDIGTFTPSHKVKIKINGTAYWLQLDAV